MSIRPTPKAARIGGSLFTTSWDDGDPADVQAAELLSAFGLRGTFYATTGPSGARLIDDDRLARLSEHHEIGNHGRTHSPFPKLTREMLEEELSWGAAEISRFGQASKVVAPPRGKVTKQVVSDLAALGYVARTAPVLGTASLDGDLLHPTFMFYPHGTAAMVRHSLRSVRMPAGSLLLAWASGRSFQRRTEALLRTALSRSSYVHLWGHSEEVERLGLWGELEHLLTIARAMEVVSATNSEVIRIMSRY